MGENTKIEWATHTFNPWIGCTKVSPACAHCYAEINTATRTRGVKWGPGQERYRTGEANWKQPLAWDREAGAMGTRARVFCASLADWLDDEVPSEWLCELLSLIERTSNLDWLLLSKRPQNWRTRIQSARSHAIELSAFTTSSFITDWMIGNAPKNVWLGCTVEDQERADERIPKLLSIPARVRFLSCEPLLGAVDLGTIATMHDGEYDALGGDWRTYPVNGRILTTAAMGKVDWVIAGGESGPHARPSHPDWFRALRDDCAETGAAFFFKQWGEWIAGDHVAALPDHEPKRICKIATDGTLGNEVTMPYPQRAGMKTICLVGKKIAGRLLDGREWNDVPALGGGVNRELR